ncbi:MAG TPA: hypothetical protein VLA89_03410, partial [Gemmatimonadales bacterium]|nr:hypothetical protein [Gemmatimonadales bacterium]
LLVGFDATFVYGPAGPQAYELDAAPGLYLLVGVDVGTLLERSLIASPGSYLLTGEDMGTQFERIMAALPGAYVVLGEASGLEYLPVVVRDRDARELVLWISSLTRRRPGA